MIKKPFSDRMVWSTTCETCLTSFAAWPHWESDTDIPDPEEWDSPSECPVCGAFMSWDFGDPLKTTIRTGYYPEDIE